MRWHPRTAGAVVAAVALALNGSARPVQTQAAPSYGVTDLGTLGGTSSVALSIEDGPFPRVHGYSMTASGEEHAFAGNAWSLGDLGTLGGARSEARAGRFGTVVGAAQLPGGAYRAFLQDPPGSMRDLGTLGGSQSYAAGLNDATVVGASLLAGDAVTRAFAYDRSTGVMSELPASLGGTHTAANAINAAGHIVGYADLPNGERRAFLYSNGITLDLGSLGGGSEALAISDLGAVVGHADVGAGRSRAFLYDGGPMRDLGTLGGASSAAMDVNSAGDIVGWADTGEGARRAFLWRDGVMIDLNTLIPPGTGWVLHRAASISDRGAIVGDGEFQGERRAFLLTPPLDIRASLTAHVNQLDTNIPNPHETGQLLTLGVTVNSNGPFTATGVTVTDTLSGPVEIVGWSGAESCTQNGLELTCRLRPVDFGRDLFVRVRSTAPGVITHSATVAADQPDPNPSNNSASESNTAVSLASLTLDPTSIGGGGASLGRATLTSRTPIGGARVTLTSSHPEIASVPSVFDVLPGCCDGGLWREFYVTTQPVSAPVMVEISATYGLVTRVVPLTILPASSRAPFEGTARAVPGTIQAEHFDEGGQGVAYFDGSAGNDGGQYRTTDVDIEATTDAGGGYNVGWIDAGEWLEYTVSVGASGAYVLEARVASPGAGGTFHVEVDGVDRTGAMSVPDTGGWQAWTTVSRVLNLEAGTRVMRVSFDTVGDSGAFGNLNWVRLTAVPANGRTPYGGAARPVPGTIQAEDFDEGGQGVAYFDGSAGNDGGQYRTTDVDIEATTDAGGGYNVGWIDAGEWLEYTVNVAASGAYVLEARVASPGAGGTFHVEVDGSDTTGPMSVPDTGGWQAWTTVSRVLNLEAGTRVMRVSFDSVGDSGAFGNLNWVRLTAVPANGRTPYGGTARRLPGIIQSEDFDDGGEGVAYHDASPWNDGGQYRETGVDIEATTDVGGGYNVGWMTAGEWLAYTIEVDEAGSYTLMARVAAAGPGGTFHIEADGVPLTGPIAIPDTGDWQNWQTVVVSPLTLGAGRQVLRVVLDADGPTGVFGNINYLQFTR